MHTRSLVILLVAIGCLLLSAQDWKQVHKADDARFAKETGLDPLLIHRMWRMASQSPNERDDASRIEKIDTDSLAERHQILLVTYAGENNCRTVTVFRRLGETNLTKIWSESKTPEGQGFCDNAFANGKVRSREGAVQVYVPQIPSGHSQDAPFLVYSYEWNGVSYRFASKDLAGPRPPQE